MRTTNILLSIIAACLILQTALLFKTSPLPVEIQSIDVAGKKQLPVSIDESIELDVSLSDIDIAPTQALRRGRLRRGTETALPVSINGISLPFGTGSLPVQIVR